MTGDIRAAATYAGTGAGSIQAISSAPDIISEYRNVSENMLSA